MKSPQVNPPKRKKMNHGLEAGKGVGPIVGKGSTSGIEVAATVGKRKIIDHMTKIVVGHMIVILGKVILVTMTMRTTKEKNKGIETVAIVGKGIGAKIGLKTHANLRGIVNLKNVRGLDHTLKIAMKVIVSIKSPQGVAGVHQMSTGQEGRKIVVVRSPVENEGPDQGGNSFS